MRKAQKKQAENMIELLFQAHLEIQKLIKGKNDREAMELLRQCQECAVELGNFIERTEKESSATIAFLEDYCEMVYRFHDILVQGASTDLDQICRELGQSLDKVKDSLERGIGIRYEIAFLPYKASMWDSLESVWQAAAEDPDYDVYVVPIPYYDKKEDGSFGQYHYEGGNFPDHVKITDYRSYDLESRRPDIIYIHNPYDNHNFVTSVAPEFYAVNLKKYTGCLVYIPYCVYEEFPSPDQEETVEFCSRYITPGLLLADKVILQSENFRCAVVGALLRYCGKDREFWEKKILALGSPKYDSLQYEGLLIKDEWKKIMTKSDGGRKKVIFYNTSLNSLLKHGKRMNQKIRSVLNLCYVHRKECMLLWRPHPLMKATIQSMIPALWEEYAKIVEEFREDGWGVYDETPDFHAAIAASDIYYGDYSSLMLLYQFTGKPALMQNIDILDYKKRLVSKRFYYDGEYIWSAAWEFNGLFRIDPKTLQISCAGQFPGEEPEGYGLFFDIAECNGKLYFCPFHAKHIAVYDKISRQFDAIGLKKSIRNIDKKFVGILADGKYIYMQGGRAHTIVRLDSETNQILYMENWVKELQRLQKKDIDVWFAKNGCIYKGELYYICLEIKYLLRITLHNFDYEFIPIRCNSTNDFRGIYQTDGLFWLMPLKKGYITCFNPCTSIWKELLLLEEGRDFCRIRSYVYFFSLKKQHFYRIDINSGKVTKFSVGEGIECVCPIGNYIFMIAYLSGRQYMFDTVRMKIINVDTTIDANEIHELNETKILKHYQEYNQYAYESGYINLELMLTMDTRDFEARTEKEYNGCGKKIYQYMKGFVK